MRKTRPIFSLLVSACLMFSLAACGNSVPGNSSSKDSVNAGVQKSSTESSAEVSDENAEPDAGTDVLVAYFSATGNTKAVAEQIAELTNGDVYEIIPASPYSEEDLAELSGNGNWMKGERLANSITAEELRSWIDRQNKS